MTPRYGRFGYTLVAGAALFLSAAAVSAQDPPPDGFGPPQMPPGGQGMFPGQGPIGGPFMPNMGMRPFMQQPPLLAGKMAEISALRQINGAGFLPKDVAAAATVLKEMRESEKAMEAKSAQLLDDQKKALLAAGPDENPPADVAPKLMEATSAHRQKMERLWARLVEQIGERKVGCLRGLLGEGMMGPMMPGMGGPMQPGMEGLMQPGRGGLVQPGMGRAQAGQRMGARGNVVQRRQAAGLQRPPQGPPPGVGPQGGPQPGPDGRSGMQGPMPGMPGMPGGPGMPMMMGPRLSLAELADLLAQKQAAMRK